MKHMMTEDGRRGAEIAGAVVDDYRRLHGWRVPSGDVPSSWQGVEVLAALLADLMLWASAERVEWLRACEVAQELYLWDADPMGGARWATSNG